MKDKEMIANVGTGIRQRRKKAGLTISQLAEQAEMDSGFLAYIENGKKMPSISTAAKLAAALGITLSDLFVETPAKAADSEYSMERQVIAILHGRSVKHRKAMLAALKTLRDPKRLEAFQELIRR